MSDVELSGSSITKTAEIGNTPTTEFRPALKSRDFSLPAEQRQSTAGSASLDMLASGTYTRGVQTPVSRGNRKAASNMTAYYDFRNACDRLAAELRRADDYMDGESLRDDATDLMVEVEQILEDLYRVEWGNRECLKRIVVAINSQINNARWTARHIAFLRDATRMLRNSYLVDDALAKEFYGLISRHGLDPFRGTVSESDVVRRYRIVEE